MKSNLPKPTPNTGQVPRLDPSEFGIALLIVMFVVALASIIVVNLTYSAYLAGRLNNATLRSLQAEYLLKSAVNFARVLIQEDTTTEDSSQDLWAGFISGQAIPLELLDIKEPGMSIEIEITPEETKIPLREILTREGGEVNKKWRGVIARLFKNLGFDEDNQGDHTYIFKDKIFNADDLVTLLIDYQDADSESYDDQGEFTSGYENEVPEGVFSNRRLKRIGELANIPGFTPSRVRQLTPLVTVFGVGRININLAPRVILQSLHEDITDSHVEAIMDFRRSQPFDDSNKNTELRSILGDDIYNDILTLVDVKSRWFQVLAKVDYGTSTYFMRSFVSKADQGELPVIRSVELFM